MVITWIAPNAHSSTIDLYDIQFLLLTGLYAADLTNCNGGLAATVTALSCTVPMTSISTLTSLAVNTLIQVKIRARNANGYGSYS